MLSLNEIKDRAFEFAKDHKNDEYERGEAQNFWIDFFEVFGIDKRRLDFEKRIKIETKGSQKYIDCFLPGEILVEHKSKGKDLREAFLQAKNYLRGLRDDELPKMILVSDFEKIRVYDLENTSGEDLEKFSEFFLEDFHKKSRFIFVFNWAKKSKKLCGRPRKYAGVKTDGRCTRPTF